MPSIELQPQPSLTTLSKFVTVIRIGFGLVWLLDAVLKFDPSFYSGMLDIIKSADGGGPSWLNGWYNFWFDFLGSAPHFFAVMVIILECYLAFALLFGFSRKVSYIIGAVFSFLIWGVAEGFGGPYVSGSTDPGAGIMYVFPFALLYVVDAVVPAMLSLDTYLEKHIGWWHVVSRRTR